MNRKNIILIAAIVMLIGAAIVVFAVTSGNGGEPQSNQPTADGEENMYSPDEPNTPDATNEPDDSKTPDESGESDAPDTPDEPADTPDEPDAPVTPDEPNVPDDSKTPDEPTTPDIPDENTPDEPNNPTTPDVSDEPEDTPNVPDVTPEDPAAPDDSDDEPDSAESGTTHTHSWDDGTTVISPSCIQAGKITYTCACGETYSQTIPKIADKHDFDEGRLSGVMMIYTCKNCGETNKVNTCVHIWTDWRIVQEGSCVDGYKQRTCENCYYREKVAISAVGHCVYEVIGEGETIRTYWCIGCYTIKTEEFPDGNPNYDPDTKIPSTPSNLPNW